MGQKYSGAMTSKDRYKNIAKNGTKLWEYLGNNKYFIKQAYLVFIYKVFGLFSM